MANLQFKDVSQSLFQLNDLILGGSSEAKQRQMQDAGSEQLLKETREKVF